MILFRIFRIPYINNVLSISEMRTTINQQRCIRTLDIFSKRLILVPILGNQHWTLVSIDILNQRIKYNNSYKSENPSLRRCVLIRNFVKNEHLRLNRLFDETFWSIYSIESLF